MQCVEFHPLSPFVRTTMPREGKPQRRRHRKRKKVRGVVVLFVFVCFFALNAALSDLTSYSAKARKKINFAKVYPQLKLDELKITDVPLEFKQLVAVCLSFLYVNYSCSQTSIVTCDHCSCCKIRRDIELFVHFFYLFSLDVTNKQTNKHYLIEVRVGDDSQTRADAAGRQEVFQNDSSQKDQRKQLHERDGYSNQMRKKERKKAT